MNNDFRETMIRVHGVERTIRTERVGSVKQLEAAHTKAVKAALVDMDRTEAERRNADELATLRRKKWADAEGLPGSGQRSRDNALVQARTRHMQRKPLKFHGATSAYVDARRGWPKVTYATAVPDYFVEVAPGEYATAEAAESMGAAEHVDEVIPGLSPARYGRGWILRHLPSVTDEKPDTHLGPVFKSRKRAREVALTELARFDFTRSQEEIIADEETAAVVKFVKLREFVAASKRNAWAEGDLREAEAAVSTLALVDAA